MIYTGQIQDIDKQIDGAPVFGVTGAAGVLYFPCYLLSGAGGIHAMFSTPPLQKGSTVILIRPDGNEPFYILGGIPAPQDQKNITVKDPSTAANTEDYTQHHIDETVISNTNTSITLSPRNDAVIDAPTIRLQLNTGKLRVSQNGAANNDVLNGTQFINTLFTYTGLINQQLQNIKGMLDSIYNEQAYATRLATLQGKVSAGVATPDEIVELPLVTNVATAYQTLNALLVTPNDTVKSSALLTVNVDIETP